MNRFLKLALLLFVFALCAAAVLRANHAREDPAPAMAKVLYSVVKTQLSAFRASDFDLAYRHAAPALQQRLSRWQFEQMIRRDFSSMTQARHVEFGAVAIDGTVARVPVFLIAPDGAARGFLYRFTTECDGWKIDRVQPLSTQPLPHLRGLRI